ncbi:HNH endonuclease family protein [Streptomyces sp. HK10]|uniref:HNH endonuclease family protein n=1 Tax=Streptomyces sp. HK10 TaxID=3373255 RepID=UPI0037482666
MLSPRRLSVLPATAALLLAVAGCGIEPGGVVDDAKPSAPATAPATSDTGGAGEGLGLAEALARLETAPESRDGYEREKFRHWSDTDQDGCDTRREVLLAEATEPPKQGEGCALTGGRWHSPYDQQTVTDPARLDIDHTVPLAEAWDSGASAWDAQRREAFANDLDADYALIAVTASTNRSKGDQDPAEWLPPATDTHCDYAADWVATKLRWSLTADTAERSALEDLAADCPDTRLSYTPAP